MEESVKLPSSSYDELAKVIAGYSRVDKESSLDAISKTIGMHRTRVSGNNGFLLGVSLIEGGNKKKATSIGKKLGQAIEHNLESEITALWRDVVENSDFLRNLLSSVRIRRGMDASALRAHVAYSAGQSKTGSVMTGAGTVIEILKMSGLLAEDEGKLVAATEQSPSEGMVEEHKTERRGEREETPTGQIERTIFASQAPGIHVSIQVRVNCTPEELEGLGAKLRGVIEELGIDPPSDAEN